MKLLCPQNIYWALLTPFWVQGLQLPNNCKPNEYYEASTLNCQSCFPNSSMVISVDGFGCTCADNSIPVGVSQCKSCNATEVVSTDGSTCVPRRCQNSSGRFVCRKCPAHYISVTQNFDGSPMKEVQCIKCARGYKPQGNTCIKCEACTCGKNQIVVRGICVAKAYVNGRPKYKNNVLHPTTLLDIVKYEYLCSQNNTRACRTLANECVKSFYSSELAGPCRIWLQSKSSIATGVPQLTASSTMNEKTLGEITLPHGQDTLSLAVLLYTHNGGVQFLQDTKQKLSHCLLPIKIKIGMDLAFDCNVNVTELSSSEHNETLTPFVYTGEDWKQLPVSLRKPNGYYVEAGGWPTNKFKRYFLVHNILSITTNITNTIYLRTLFIQLRIARDIQNSAFRVHITTEAQYATKSPLSSMVTMTLKVEHEMPNADVLRGLEIWGGVLGALLSIYAMVQWRSTLRRGGLHISGIPLLAGAIADTLYFSALFSTLHSLAAEAGMVGLTLPLAHREETILKAFIYSSVTLKVIKIIWINWNQCRCDIFFLDWSEHNSTWKDAETTMTDNLSSWKMTMLAKEWSKMQTKRRASPGVVVTLVILILHIITPWLPQSQGYKWATANIVWWFCYTVILLYRCLLDRLFGSPASNLPRICTGMGISVLVFEEEYYAHYIHGRNDTKDVRSMAGPLAACRVICAPHLRDIFNQLSMSGPGILDGNDKKQALLSRFMAAFFERALDGFSWVASERTIFERLLDVELISREAGNTSTLLHDGDNSPSAFAVMWWGQEWNLVTFDAMVFSSMLMATGDFLLAALVTLILWQVLKLIRDWFGNRNIKGKTEINIY